MNKTTRIAILLAVTALATGLGTGYSYFWKTRRISEEINKEHNSNNNPDSNANNPVYKSSIQDKNNINAYPGVATESTTGGTIGKTRLARKSQTPLKLAMERFHGSDWVGADGIWRKAGFDLAYLHELSANGESDELLLNQIRELRPHWFLNNEGIVVDVISHPDADLKQLEMTLKDLGLRQTYTFGGVVTGFLPTRNIPEVSKLEEIAYIHPSRLLASN